MKKKAWLIAPAILLALLLAFLLYAMPYYHAADEALQALESDSVHVERTDFGWLFDGPAADAAYIFYPGAKVDEAAYAPLLHRLAESGVDVCLVKMPFHLAIFGMNRADGILEQYDYENWYIGGHSLGGAMAANYAAEHDLSGVILLAAYPTKAVDEPMLILYGEADGVLSRERVAAASQFGTVTEVVLDGGNHAYFGNYGEQKGDNAAALSPAEQQELTVEAIASWLAE